MNAFVSEDVDEFLERCARSLDALEAGRSPEVTAQDIVVQQFRQVGFLQIGYDADQVDDFLDEVVAQMRVLEVDAAARADRAYAEAARSGEARAALTSGAVRAVRLGRASSGVDIVEVDAFVARCAESLERYEHGGTSQLSAADVLSARFQLAASGSGYDSDGVDEFLGDVAVSLAHYERLRV